MENKTKNKIKLGVFVTISLTLLIFGLYFIGERQQLFSNTFKVSGVFKDISGLQIGNNVRLSGINVGIIEEIEQISDTTVRVDMLVDVNSKKFIKKNAKAIIGSDGLMGNKIVLIIPGTPGQKEIAENGIIGTSQAISMDDILLKIKVTSDNAASITDDLAVLMSNIREGRGTIGKLFMDTTFADNIDQTLVSIKQGAGGFKQNMDAAKQNILLRGFFKKKEKEKEKQNDKK